MLKGTKAAEVRARRDQHEGTKMFSRLLQKAKVESARRSHQQRDPARATCAGGERAAAVPGGLVHGGLFCRAVRRACTAGTLLAAAHAGLTFCILNPE